MERRVRGNPHARCGAGEKMEIVSKSYLLLLFTESPSRLWCDTFSAEKAEH